MSKTAFITGGTGYIGRHILSSLPPSYTIHALVRNPITATTTLPPNALAIPGTLADLPTITREAATVDIFFHVAFDLDFTNPNDTIAAATTRNKPVIKAAISSMKKGSVFVLTTGALVSAPRADGGEVDEEAPAAEHAFGVRMKNEEYALALGKEHGVTVVVIRPAAFVYGEGGSGIAMFMSEASKNKASTYILPGTAQVSAVHVADCGKAYVLAAEKALETGQSTVYNAVSDTGVSFKEIAEVIGQALQVPVMGITKEQAEETVGGIFAVFLSTSSRCSGAKAERELGWAPRKGELLKDVIEGSYKELAKKIMA